MEALAWSFLWLETATGQVDNLRDDVSRVERKQQRYAQGVVVSQVDNCSLVVVNGASLMREDRQQPFVTRPLSVLFTALYDDVCFVMTRHTHTHTHTHIILFFDDPHHKVLGIRG
jgi:hypothetical protein